MTTQIIMKEGKEFVINHAEGRAGFKQITVSISKEYLKVFEILLNKEDGLYCGRSELFRVVIRDLFVKLENEMNNDVKSEECQDFQGETVLDLSNYNPKRDILDVKIIDEITGETFKIETTVLGNKEDWLESKKFRKNEPMDKMIYGGGHTDFYVKQGEEPDESDIDPDVVIARGRQTKYNSRGIMDEYYNGGL